MFQTLSNPRAAYEKVGLDVRVETSDPHKLILMLFDGALLAVNSAAAYLANGDKMAMSQSILKASSIIAEGLRASIDTEHGGEIAVRLSALYDYMNLRLQFANIKGDKLILAEVRGLLEELRSAWSEIGSNPVVHPDDRSKAAHV
jgi:flagellar protein FliS